MFVPLRGPALEAARAKYSASEGTRISKRVTFPPGVNRLRVGILRLERGRPQRKLIVKASATKKCELKLSAGRVDHPYLKEASEDDHTLVVKRPRFKRLTAYKSVSIDTAKQWKKESFDGKVIYDNNHNAVQVTVKRDGSDLSNPFTVTVTAVLNE